MPPRIPALSASRSFCIRPKTTHQISHTRLFAPTCSQAVRSLSSSKDLPQSPDQKGPNTETLPSVSEEDAAMKKARGGQGPELEQGTPIQEVIKRDKEAQEKLPKVMKDALKETPGSKRNFSTSAIRREGELSKVGPSDIEAAVVASGTSSLIPSKEDEGETTSLRLEDILEPLPALRPEDMFTRRYPAVVDQLVGLIMRHGKKGVAQKNVAIILNKLRNSPPPKIRPERPLLPGHPPPTFLPLNPLIYLTLAIDSLAPLIRMRAQKGAAGGGSSLMIPVPLAVRRRRRTAIEWILDAASKKESRIPFRGSFAHRVADEIVAVIEGRSALWDKRMNLHKLGVVGRSAINHRPRKKRAV